MAIAGVLKSRFNKKWVFWVGFILEAVRATILSAALIVQLYRISYSHV